MLKIYDKNSNSFTNTDFKEECLGYSEFKAITFVSSLNVVEEVLMMFDKVELINGSTDDTDRMKLFNQYMDMSNRLEDFFSLNKETKDKIVNTDYELFLSKDKIIHTKIYILKNQSNYKIMVGSANLTNNGVFGNNHEYLEKTVGNLDDEYLKQMENYFSELKDLCVEYLPIEDIKTKSEKVIVEEFILSQYESLKEKNERNDEIKKIASIVNKKDVETIINEKEEENKMLDLMFTKTGSVRNKSNFGNRLIEYLNVSVSENFLEKTDDIMWYYSDEHEKVVIGKEYLEDIDTLNISPKPIIDIIDSYYGNKYEDERHQVYTAFMYLMLSPFLWKIRELYSEAGIPREDVPIAVNILGVGGTGKSTLLNKYFGKLIGDRNVQTFSKICKDKKGKEVRSNGVNIMSGYYNSDIIKPLFVDELPMNFYSNQSGENLLKAWSNDRTGIHPTIITASNTNSGILKPQLIRRMLLIPIDSKYKERDEQEYDHQDLLDALGQEHMFLMMKRLEKRFSNLTMDDLNNIRKDYLYIVKSEFKQWLEEFSISYDVDQFYENYNIINIRGKSYWSNTLIANANNVVINPTNENEIIVYSRSFKGTSEQQAARSLLPGNVIITTQGSDLSLNRKELEEFIGYSVDRIFENQDTYKTAKVLASAFKEAVQNTEKKSLFKRIFK